MKNAVKSLNLSKICTVQSGFPFRGSIDALPKGTVAVVQMRDILEAVDIDWLALTHVELPPNRKAEYLSNDDILFTTRGGRNTALILRDVPERAVAPVNLFVIRVNAGNEILPRFLAWQINQPAAQEYFAVNATGSHIKNITRSVLEALPIFIPSIETQQRLIGFADAAALEMQLLNSLISNRQRQMNALASQFLSEKA